jgi:ADP-ribose pyrophosphatase YjhB (NUDIX family)
MDYVIASGPVIIEKEKVLLIKDNKDDFYKFPGGTVHEGQGLEETCLRETKEEIGVDVEIIKPLKTLVLWKKPGTGEKIPVVLVHYLAKIKEGQEIKAGQGIEEVKWISIQNLKKYKMAPNVDYILKDF